RSSGRESGWPPARTARSPPKTKTGDTTRPAAHQSPQWTVRSRPAATPVPERIASRRRHARECGEFGDPGALEEFGGGDRIGRSGAVGGAQPGQRARAARGLAGVADPAAVEDDAVRQHGPVALLDELGHRELDLHRVLLGGPRPPPDQPLEVRVDGQPRYVEGIAEDDVGGL